MENTSSYIFEKTFCCVLSVIDHCILKSPVNSQFDIKWCEYYIIFYQYKSTETVLKT